MKALEYDVLVDENHTAVIHLPEDIPPGRHTLCIILQEQKAAPHDECPETLPTITVTQWPENLSLRREGIYDDQGR